MRGVHRGRCTAEGYCYMGRGERGAWDSSPGLTRGRVPPPPGAGKAMAYMFIIKDSRVYCCVQTLEIEQVRRGPRECDAAGTVPQPRFAHAAVAVALSGGDEGTEQVRWLLCGRGRGKGGGGTWRWPSALGYLASPAPLGLLAGDGGDRRHACTPLPRPVPHRRWWSLVA